MMKTTYSILLSASMVIALLFVEVALASTFERYNCGCDPTAEDDQICSCSNAYTLKSLGTKEFRAECTNPTAFHTICIADKARKTTCTETWEISINPFSSSVTTRSCTNWALFTRDDIDVRVMCFGNDSQFDKEHPCR